MGDKIVCGFFDGGNPTTDLYYLTIARIDVDTLDYDIEVQNVETWWDTDSTDCVSKNTGYLTNLICYPTQWFDKKSTFSFAGAFGNKANWAYNKHSNINDVVNWTISKGNLAPRAEELSGGLEWDKPLIIKVDETINTIADAIGAPFGTIKTIAIAGAVIIGGIVLLKVINTFKK